MFKETATRPRAQLERVYSYCYMCQQGRYTLYCAACVTAGNFTSSRSNEAGEPVKSYSLKQLHLSKLAERRHMLEQEVKVRCFAQRREQDMLGQLQSVLYCVQSGLITSRELDDDVDTQDKEVRQMRIDRQPRTAKLNQRKQEIRETESSIEKLNKTLTSTNKKIDQLIRERIHELCYRILPICRDRTSKDEAKPTEYWPEQSDYRHLLEWIRMRPRRVFCINGQQISEPPSQKVYRIAAGLMKLTKLVDALARYLDIFLPYKVAPYHFSIATLTDEQLVSALDALSGNILMVCASQQMTAAEIDPAEMVKNIRRVVNVIQLNGQRSGPFKLSEELTAAATAFRRSLLDPNSEEAGKENPDVKELEGPLESECLVEDMSPAFVVIDD